MVNELLIPIEVDRILRYKPGKAERLAKRGKLPHVRLPDGTIRFRESDVEQLLMSSVAGVRSAQEVA
jgi:predicted site-specific integrase-resolvase